MRYSRGVTMIETLLYLALFALLIAGLVVAGYGLLENASRNQSGSMMQEEAAFLLGKIDWAMNGAQTVSIPAENASGHALSIKKYDGTLIVISISGTAMLFNGVRLNDTNVMIRDLVFIHTHPKTNAPENIEAGFVISIRMPNGVIISETASTTDYIRK